MGTELKVLARVKFNEGHAYVLNELPTLVYTKYKTCIIGTDGVFYQCYYYETPSKNWQAFGGRKFTLTMHDGEVVECFGQWWHGINEEALCIIGEKLGHATCNSLEDLTDCYVYYGYMVKPSEFKKIISKYKGITYRYDDYDYMYASRKKYGKVTFKKHPGNGKYYYGRKIFIRDYRSQMRALKSRKVKFSKK